MQLTPAQRVARSDRNPLVQALRKADEYLIWLAEHIHALPYKAAAWCRALPARIEEHTPAVLAWLEKKGITPRLKVFLPIALAGLVLPFCLMEIDFGKTVNLTAIWVNSYYSSYCATGMKLETSVDGSKWTDWGDVSHERSSTGKYYINLSAAEDVRYMRLVFTGGGSGSYGIDIDGMMFFGNK